MAIESSLFMKMRLLAISSSKNCIPLSSSFSKGCQFAFPKQNCSSLAPDFHESQDSGDSVRTTWFNV